MFLDPKSSLMQQGLISLMANSQCKPPTDTKVAATEPSPAKPGEQPQDGPEPAPKKRKTQVGDGDMRTVAAAARHQPVRG
eukprot:6715599-Pyramimonas_sp.AAC.1